jgi:hypothetical protein
MVKIDNEEKIRVAGYEYVMRFTFSEMYYVSVYKKLLVPQLRLSYALLFYIFSYFTEEIVMLECYHVFG